MKLLTNLLFEPKGKHNPAMSYNIKDTVMSADGSRVYFALQNVPAGIALTNEDYWMLQMDISSSKSAMDEALASFGSYAKTIGMRVKGETAKASGNPVSFLPDAGSLLQPVTVLEPKQAGSGDPYPAGGGKNLIQYYSFVSGYTQNGLTATINKDKSITVTGTATVDTWFYLSTYSASYDGGYELPEGTYLVSGCPEGGAFDKYGIGVSVYRNGVYVDGMGNSDFGTGGRAIITKGDLLDCYIRIRAGYGNLTFYPMIRKEGTPEGYELYENIRPISGYDALGLNHTGKNLLSNTAYTQTKNGVTFTINADGSVHVKGTTTADNTFLNLNYVNGYTSFLSAGNYILSGAPGTALLLLITNGLWDTYVNKGAEKTFTIGEGVTNSWARIQIDYAGTTLDETLYPMVRRASDTDATYKSYRGNTYTVQLGQTVYGGRMDWLTGKLVAEYGYVELTGNETITAHVSSNGYNGALIANVLPVKETRVDGVISHDIVSKYLNSPGVVIGNASRTISWVGALDKIGLSTISEFATWLANQKAAGTPVQIAYKLAEPFEIGPFTPHIISAADPEQTNTLYGDGRIEAEYVKPLHVSIEERVAAAMAAMHIE